MKLAAGCLELLKAACHHTGSAWDHPAVYGEGLRQVGQPKLFLLKYFGFRFPPLLVKEIPMNTPFLQPLQSNRKDPHAANNYISVS